MADASVSTPPRRLGFAKQALDEAGINASGTLRNWVGKGFIYAVRVGNGPYQYDLDDCARMRVEYPRPDVDARIRALVDAAPAPTAKQLNEIRLLLHAAPEPSGC